MLAGLPKGTPPILVDSRRKPVTGPLGLLAGGWTAHPPTGRFPTSLWEDAKDYHYGRQRVERQHTRKAGGRVRPVRRHLDDVIETLRRRDRATWARVYERFVDRVYRHALYRLRGDPDAAEGVTQEVFVRAIESIATFQGEEDGLLVWMQGISRRIMARRARNLRPLAARPLSLSGGANHDDRASFLDPTDPRPSPDDELAKQDERWLTGAALSALPPHWERVLRWKYCEALPVVEIAGRLDISPKAAESLLGRARGAFRKTYLRFLAANDGGLYEIEEWSDV